MPSRPIRPRRAQGPRDDRFEEVAVERVAAGGDGIARAADGRVMFVEGGLPGEQVQVRVHTVKKDYARGSVVEVVDASPLRVAPPCPALAAGCGGCAWQHVRPDAQLSLKADIVRDALRRVGKRDDVEVLEGGRVPDWGYRTTARLAVAPDSRVGFRGAGSHRVVPLDACPVTHPALSALLGDLRVRGADELTLRVSHATGEVTALPHVGEARRQAVVEGLPDHVAVGPDGAVHEMVAGARLRVSAPSFFQSGPDAAELLVRAVAAAGGAPSGDESFLDAYGGVGLFGATLGGASVVLVESAASSCGDARVNLPGARVVQARFEDWAPQPVDVAVADPARAGLGAEAAAVLAATGARTVVLVSCDPVSMARDTALLASHGYRVGTATVLDLFPHTHHVEVVTGFHR